MSKPFTSDALETVLSRVTTFFYLVRKEILQGKIMEKEWTIGELLATSNAYWRGCTLQAAVRLDIFSAIAGGKDGITDIAADLGTDPRATGFLLDALAGMGLLSREDEVYANTGAAASFLVKDSPQYMGYIILHHHHLLDGWSHLDKAVLTGEPVPMRSHGEDVDREAFLMGMFNLAMGNAPTVTAAIDLGGRRRLLDLGGGPGTYAIHFCLANPDLRAVIYDRATTEPFARKTIEKFSLAERIDFIGGDFITDPIEGGSYDVAWLSHVLHSNGPDECSQLIVKVVAAMESGGLILIHDFILNNDKAGPEFPALFSLNMLINNPAGRSYSEEEIMAMLKHAGVQDIQRLSWQGPNNSAIICGTV